MSESFKEACITSTKRYLEYRIPKMDRDSEYFLLTTQKFSIYRFYYEKGLNILFAKFLSSDLYKTISEPIVRELNAIFGCDSYDKLSEEKQYDTLEEFSLKWCNTFLNIVVTDEDLKNPHLIHLSFLSVIKNYIT